MNLTIKEVTVNNPDFIKLVDELNNFFLAEWGSVATSYDHHHNLTTMSSAFVAYDGEEAVGCGAWKILADGQAEIKRMYVKEEYRQHGVAGMILKTIEKQIKAKNYPTVVLETGAEMLAAIKFYQKNGYQIIPNYGEFIGDERCICLEKKLK